MSNSNAMNQESGSEQECVAQPHILPLTVGVSATGGTLLEDIQCISVGPENT